MAAEGLRRSTRARKPVQNYAAEQAAEDEAPAVKAPPPKRKRVKVEVGEDEVIEEAPAKKTKKAGRVKVEDEDDEDFDANEVADAVPAKKTKHAGKKGKARKNDDNDNEDDDAADDWSWKKVGLSIFIVNPKTMAKAPRAKGNNWHASAAANRIAINQSKIPRLREGEEESRVRPYVESPPPSYHKALAKANKERMFVLDRTRDTEPDCHAHHPDCPRETVQIAGSSGNVYTVSITHMPSCTCPTTIFQKGGTETVCKHVLYILHNVLKAPDHLKQQNAFLTSELQELFANAPPLPAEVAAAPEEEFDGKRKPVEDDCPICCMEFEDNEEVVWCRAACGNNVHKACFDQWAKTKLGHVTCPFCRTEWEEEAPKAQKVKVAAVDMSAVATGAGGYRNVRDQLDYD